MPITPYDPKSAQATGAGTLIPVAGPDTSVPQPTRTFRGDMANEASMLALVPATLSDWIRRMDLGGQVFELVSKDVTQISSWKSYPLGDGTTPLINDLTTGGDTAALTATQGKALKSITDNLGTSKADKQTVTDLATTVTQKADSTAVTQALGSKADQTAVDSLGQTVSGKAAQTTVDTLTATVSRKADTTLVATKATLQTGALASDTNAAPNAAAVRAAIDTAVAGVSTGGGVTPTVRITDSTTIPLDTAGEGKAMPPVAGNVTQVNGARLYQVAASPVLNGLCVEDLVTTGAGSITFAAGITVLGATIDPTEVGRMYQLRFWQQAVGTFVLVLKGNLIDVTAPAIQTPHIEGADRLTILVPIFDTGSISMLGTLSGVTLGGADAGSFTKASHSYAAGVYSLTLAGSPANHGTALTIAFAAGFFSDNAVPTPNLSAATSATAVVNNIPVGVPNAPTISNGGATSSSQTINITPGATDGAHGSATSFETQYSTNGGTTWLAGYTGTTFSPVIGSLAAGTSYQYQSRGINGTGPGAWSAPLSATTSSALAGSITTSGITAVAEADGYTANLTTLATVDWFTMLGDTFNVLDHKLGGSAFTLPPTLDDAVSTSSPGYGSQSFKLNWTDGTFNASGYANIDHQINATGNTAGDGGGIVIVAAIGTTPRTVRLYVDGFGSDRLTNMNVKCVLSDGSHAPVTASIQSTAYGKQAGFVDFTINAASAGQHATFTIHSLAVDGSVGGGVALFGAAMF